MTIISAVRCAEGVVLTSDSRETRGMTGRRVARQVQKIYEPRPGFLVAWAGFQNVAQAFALALERADGLSPSLDRVEVKRRLEGLIAQIRADGETDYAEWLVAWWSEKDTKAVAAQLFSARTGQWVTDWTFAGDPRPVDIATIVSETLRFTPTLSLSLEQAKVLALKVARDTISIGVESVGGDVQLGAVSRDGVEMVGGEALRGLHDTLDLWEARTAELLPGATSVPSDTQTPDHGLRPPT